MPTVSKPVIVGIDPGKSGGIAILQGSSLITHLMPDSDLSLRKIADGLEAFEVEGLEVVVYIEKVGAMPGQGVTSMFTFGQGYGKIQQAFCKLRREFVTPQTWQKGLRIQGRKKVESKPQFKNRLKLKAEELYPKSSVWELGVTKQRAVCDAILIAEYGKRKESGTL